MRFVQVSCVPYMSEGTAASDSDPVLHPTICKELQMQIDAANRMLGYLESVPEEYRHVSANDSFLQSDSTKRKDMVVRTAQGKIGVIPTGKISFVCKPRHELLHIIMYYYRAFFVQFCFCYQNFTCFQIDILRF